VAENTEGKISVERPGHTLEDNIKMDPQEAVGSRNGVDWIHLAQDRDQWRAIVGVVMNLSVLQTAGKFLTTLHLQEGPASCS
jgi:hypothetical protein